MADAIALPQNPPSSISNKFLRLIPGVALLAVIGFAGKLLEKNINLYAKSHHWTIPNIEYVLWAILIGFIEIAGSLAFMTFLGRLFGLRPKLTTLLAVGSAVCGVSAIIATKGAIEADDEDSSFAIAAILALGALSLFTFPLIGHALHLSEHAYGAWA